MKYSTLVLLLFSISSISCSQPEIKVSIIPQPNKMEVEGGRLAIEKEINLSSNSVTLLTLAEKFKTDVAKLVSVDVGNHKMAKIKLEIKAGFKDDESYTLQTSKEGIEIQAGSEKGVFYGLQTLKQLIFFSNHENEKIIIPYMTIEDGPRFGWRGIMLDESRHFFGPEKVKQLLDLMALHKLNVFHWHLTDDPGWRIEIKKYPKLASVGGLGDELNPDSPAQYYTQDEIKEIVKYAGDRFIEVIPEIDMPGHARAANRAYPEFSGGGSKSHPEFTFNPGKPETYAYLTDILKEIAALFQSNYIHLGGDEVHFGNENWKTDAHVKHLMKTEKLQDLKAVETYFVNRMADSIKMLGKTVIGWDEIVEHNLAPDNSLVMWWRHDKTEKLAAALSNKYNVVLCPRIPLYFDFDQNESHEWGRKWGGAFSSLELVYAFPPDTLPGFTQNQQYINGIQANIWTERIHDNKRFDFMTYPRLSALAEAGWTLGENKGLEDFKRRLKPMLSLFDEWNISYYNPFQPILTPEPPSGYKQK
jgi:hexosaminidase